MRRDRRSLAQLLGVTIGETENRRALHDAAPPARSSQGAAPALTHSPLAMEATSDACVRSLLVHSPALSLRSEKSGARPQASRQGETDSFRFAADGAHKSGGWRLNAGLEPAIRFS